MARRQTKTEKINEWNERVARYWRGFRPKLLACDTRAKAIALAMQPPPVDAPGRLFHTNLRHFAEHLSPPHRADSEEREIYIELARKWAQAGDVDPQNLPRIEAAMMGS